MNLKKIKLNAFEESTLKDQEMNQIRGGNSVCHEGDKESCERVTADNCEDVTTTTTTPSCNCGGEDSSTTSAFN